MSSRLRRGGAVGASRPPTERMGHLSYGSRPTAVRNFNPAYVGSGSFATKRYVALHGSMSALPLKADQRADVLVCPLCASSGRMHRSKRTAQLIGSPHDSRKPRCTGRSLAQGHERRRRVNMMSDPWALLFPSRQASQSHLGGVEGNPRGFEDPAGLWRVSERNVGTVSEDVVSFYPEVIG